MVCLTFTWRFNAVHRLWSGRLDPAGNVEVFGKCANPAGHGHQYRLEVTVSARVDEKEPVVMRRGAIRRLVADVLEPQLCHADLNSVFAIDGFIPTGEHVADEIRRLIEPALPEGVVLAQVRLVETHKNSFVSRGAAQHGARPPRAR